VQPRQARLEQIPRVESGGQRMRGGYPPPRQPQARMGGMDKSNQQRMIIIGAAVLVLLFVVICAVVAFVQREALMDTATGIFDPSGRETQVQLDIQMGLTQTAAVSVDIPATVQAQIALTQTAVSAAAPPAAQQPPAEQPPAADAAETQYVQAVKDGITAYNTAMSKIDELLNAAQADANKLNDEQWKSEFSSATANVTQTSDSLRQLSPPQRMADIQPDVVEAATNLDNAVKLLTEYITDKNAEKVTQAAEAKTKGNDAINKVQQKIQALGL